jgi:bifunctional non-homologous end joining protein LigD
VRSLSPRSPARSASRTRSSAPDRGDPNAAVRTLRCAVYTRVGTGYSGAESRSLRNNLETFSSTKPSFGKSLPAGAEKGVRWAEPRLVCEIEYRGWTQDGLVRQASYKGLREDKPANEVTLEIDPTTSKPGNERGLAGIRLTHSERILWEESGITKQGLAEFYVDIAEWILPHIVGRPLSLLRCPSGVSERCFFAKHPWQGLSAAIRRVDVGADEPMLAIDDLAGLIGLVQAGVVEIHPWGSTVNHLEQPDRVIFDLDPGEDVPWGAVIDAALEVRDRLNKVGLESFVKTSGGKGFHVVLPIEPSVSWAEAKQFTGSFAEAMSKAHPQRYVATMAKRARRGRIFVDYFRNSRGATAVAPYSTRARPEASISTPLEWDELSRGVRPDHFRIGNLRQRIDFLSKDPWRNFFEVRQNLPTLG